MANFNNSKNIACVIQFQKKEAPLSLPEREICTLGSFAYILHDKDKLDDGSLKGVHAHLVIKSDKGQSSQNWIKQLAQIFKVEEDAISIQVCKNFKGAIRYLTHVDNKDKFQYEQESIKTNDKKMVFDAFNAKKKLTTMALLELAENSPNPFYSLASLAEDPKDYNNAYKALENIQKSIHSYQATHEMRDLSEIAKRVSLIAGKWKMLPELEKDLIQLIQFIQFGDNIK